MFFTIRYTLESSFRSEPVNRPSVELLRDERLVKEIVTHTAPLDPLSKKSFVPDNIFGKNISPGLTKPDPWCYSHSYVRNVSNYRYYWIVSIFCQLVNTIALNNMCTLFFNLKILLYSVLRYGKTVRILIFTYYFHFQPSDFIQYKIYYKDRSFVLKWIISSFDVNKTPIK